MPATAESERTAEQAAAARSDNTVGELQPADVIVPGCRCTLVAGSWTRESHMRTHSADVAREGNLRRRRRFLGASALTVAAAQLGMITVTHAQPIGDGSKHLPSIKPGTNKSFGPLRQIEAGLLSVGYTEVGPRNGPAVILLHGWPYDIHSFVDVAPLLAAAGYRVI